MAAPFVAPLLACCGCPRATAPADRGRSRRGLPAWRSRRSDERTLGLGRHTRPRLLPPTSAARPALLPEASGQYRRGAVPACREVSRRDRPPCPPSLSGAPVPAAARTSGHRPASATPVYLGLNPPVERRAFLNGVLPSERPVYQLARPFGHALPPVGQIPPEMCAASASPAGSAPTT